MAIAITAVLLSLMIFVSVFAINSIKQMSGQLQWMGVPLAIIVFCGLTTGKVAIEVGLLFSNFGTAGFF